MGEINAIHNHMPRHIAKQLWSVGGIKLEKGSIHDHSVIHLFKNSFIKKNGRRKKKKAGIRILLLLGYGELKIQHFWNVMVVLRFAECSF